MRENYLALWILVPHLLSVPASRKKELLETMNPVDVKTQGLELLIYSSEPECKKFLFYIPVV